MSFADREIACLDCTQNFIFTAGEQEFYERKGFKEEPKRCKPCREQRKQKRNDAPVTPRPARAANANAAPASVAPAGFGFRGGDDAGDTERGNEAFRPREDEDSDNIGNRMPGAQASPARPRAVAARSNGNGGGERVGNGNGAGERVGNGNGERQGAGNGGAERGGANRSDRREQFDATCAQCGTATRVPFKPVAGRPVYCRDCYASRAASAGGR